MNRPALLLGILSVALAIVLVWQTWPFSKRPESEINSASLVQVFDFREPSASGSTAVDLGIEAEDLARSGAVTLTVRFDEYVRAPGNASGSVRCTVNVLLAGNSIHEWSRTWQVQGGNPGSWNRPSDFVTHGASEATINLDRTVSDSDAGPNGIVRLSAQMKCASNVVASGPTFIVVQVGPLKVMPK